jgi:hypothetical protein
LSHGAPSILLFGPLRSRRRLISGFRESPESFPRWRAGDFLFEKKVTKENTQVRFKSAN